MLSAKNGCYVGVVAMAGCHDLGTHPDERVSGSSQRAKPSATSSRVAANRAVIEQLDEIRQLSFSSSHHPKHTLEERSRRAAATAKRGASGKLSATPPAASVAAAQKVLRTVERREDTLRKAVKRHKKSLKQLKKTISAHRGTVKSLKTDLDKVSKTRKSVSSHL